MTYFRFHLLFVVPWVVLGLVTQSSRWMANGHWQATLITLGIVYGFTVPWDNWAVKRGIWGFRPGTYTFRIFELPVEECLFFGLQSLMAIGVTLALEPRIPDLAWQPARTPLWVCGLITTIWVVVGWRVWRWPGRVGRPAYAFHMGFWMVPIVLLQLALGPDLLLPKLPLITGVMVLVGTYLTLADVMAVRWKLWFFDERQILGPKCFRILPWEEAVFFYLTTLLVVQSLLLWRWFWRS